MTRPCSGAPAVFAAASILALAHAMDDAFV
jgi:hypothetical protein